MWKSFPRASREFGTMGVHMATSSSFGITGYYWTDRLLWPGFLESCCLCVIHVQSSSGCDSACFHFICFHFCSCWFPFALSCLLLLCLSLLLFGGPLIVCWLEQLVSSGCPTIAMHYPLLESVASFHPCVCVCVWVCVVGILGSGQKETCFPFTSIILVLWRRREGHWLSIHSWGANPALPTSTHPSLSLHIMPGYISPHPPPGHLTTSGPFLPPCCLCVDPSPPAHGESLARLLFLCYHRVQHLADHGSMSSAQLVTPASVCSISFHSLSTFHGAHQWSSILRCSHSQIHMSLLSSCVCVCVCEVWVRCYKWESKIYFIFITT